MASSFSSSASTSPLSPVKIEHVTLLMDVADSMHNRKRRKIWQDKEDAIVEAYVDANPVRTRNYWDECSLVRNGTRDAKQVGERWREHLAPGVIRASVPWSLDEDQKLHEAYGTHPNKWTEISECLRRPNGRTRPPNACKNRYHQTRKGRKSALCSA